jgi:TRAP-type C4-dicarboxylate transport system permease large subunit
VPIAIIFVIVFGGIYGGLFTPTEGAAVGAAATFVAALAKREITWAKFKHCFYATAESSAMIFLIFIGADLMNSALRLTQVPAQLASVVNGWGLSPVMVVAAIMLFYVVLGSVMDELSMILLTIPIFFPMIMGLDFGMAKESVAIWFGIMVLMTVGFGMLAPPVGPQRLRRQRHGQGRADRRELPRRDAVPRLRHDPHDRPAAVPVDLALAGQVHRLVRS